MTGANVLVAIFAERESHAAYFLQEQDMTRYDAVNYISHGIAKRAGLAESRPARGADDEMPGAESTDGPKKKTDALEAYCVNLNDKAKKGKIDPLIGRDQEIARTIQVLCRRSKNNPLYVGDPGVGKTAIAEGLARRIVNGEVPDVLKGSTVFALDMGALLAGTRYRGDFEERLKQVVKEIEEYPKAIMFIDEIHTVIGAGATSGWRHGCLEPPEAGARRRHHPLHRLDHLQGIPAVLREGSRAGTALPEDRRERADGPRRDRDPEGAEALLRGASPRPLHQRRHQGGGGAFRPLHQRPQAARQGDRRDRMQSRRRADARRRIRSAAR